METKRVGLKILWFSTCASSKYIPFSFRKRKRSVSTPKRKTDVDDNTTRSVSTPKRKMGVDDNTTRSVSTPKKKQMLIITRQGLYQPQKENLAPCILFFI
ncbi:MAG: hypothetical protein AB1391_02530 [Candidatus Micrarchaeota archaeon]